MPKKLLSAREVAELIGAHPSAPGRLARAGLFPKPIKLGSERQSRVRWSAEAIEAWIREQSDAAQAADSVSARSF
jgi:predicted DNA-binding transcriptional regulator AlpA